MAIRLTIARSGSRTTTASCGTDSFGHGRCRVLFTHRRNLNLHVDPTFSTLTQVPRRWTYRFPENAKAAPDAAVRWEPRLTLAVVGTVPRLSCHNGCSAAGSALRAEAIRAGPGVANRHHSHHGFSGVSIFLLIRRTLTRTGLRHRPQSHTTADFALKRG